jgi:hypothetical protein
MIRQNVISLHRSCGGTAAESLANQIRNLLYHLPSFFLVILRVYKVRVCQCRPNLLYQRRITDGGSKLVVHPLHPGAELLSRLFVHCRFEFVANRHELDFVIRIQAIVFAECGDKIKKRLLLKMSHLCVPNVWDSKMGGFRRVVAIDIPLARW